MLSNIEAQLGDDLDGGQNSQPLPLGPPEDHRPPADDPSTSSGGTLKLLAGVVGVGAIAVAGVFGWPVLADAFGTEEPPPQLAAVAPPVDAEPTQRFVIDGDMIFLEGTVPDMETSASIESAASQLLGPDRVTNNFEVSEGAVYDPDQPVQLSVAETILFETGDAALRAQYEPLIALTVELMSTESGARLTLVGHTDDIGEEATNQALSVRRATTVADEIARRGVDPERLTVEGRGEVEPLESNETPEGRAVNRRVEFLISGLLI